MALPETLHDMISGSRCMIQRANIIDFKTKAHNTIAQLRNGRAFILETSRVSAAFDDADRAISEFAQSANFEQHRDSVLEALDAVERALEGARPNEHAKALGVDWL